MSYLQGPIGGNPAVSIAVGLTTITGGNSGRVLFDNAGVLGEYPITGSGNVILSAGTFSSTTGQTYTFPTTSATIARTDAGQTFTGTNVFGVLQASSLALAGVSIGTNILVSTSFTLDQFGNVTANNLNTTNNITSTSNTFRIQGGVSGDIHIGRQAAATWRLGFIDGAAPIAQTLQVQGSRAGTDSNTGGANFTLQSGTGTGTGTGSAMIFNVPLLAASGSGTQTPTEVIRLQGGATPILKYTANNSTGAGSALLGTNSPASTLTAPYTWITVLAGDGSTCYLPIWK